MTFDRVLPLEGVHNFRDFGDYAVAGGGRLKKGILWRSGQHHGANEADLERISALNLVNIYDLRSSRERSTHPCRRPAGFSGEVHFAEVASNRLAPHVAAAATRQADAETTRRGMIASYGRMAYRPELIDMMRRMFTGLAEGSGPSLVNCMAGKDRTGVAVALVHFALGVHRDDALSDYLLTNTAGDPEARISSGMRTIAEIGGQTDEAVLRVLMGVEPEWFEAFVGQIESDHGSVEGYLREVLGLDDALRERMCAALLDY